MYVQLQGGYSCWKEPALLAVPRRVTRLVPDTGHAKFRGMERRAWELHGLYIPLC